MLQKCTRMHIACFVFALFHSLYPSIKNDLIVPFTKEAHAITQQLQDKNKKLPEQERKELLKKLEGEQLRSLAAAASDGTNKINYGPTAFASADAFYLAATDKAPNDLAKVKDKTLVRANITNVSGPIVQLTPMAGDKVNVNGRTVDGAKELIVSPLQGAKIDAVTLVGGFLPAVAVNDAGQVFLVEDRFNGTQLRENTDDSILDAAGADALVANLAGSNDTIFAAVSSGDFGLANSGIVRLQREPLTNGAGQLKVVKLADGTLGSDNAYKIDLAAHDVTGAYVESNTGVKFAFSPDDGSTLGITMAELGKVVDMHWDEDLGRLYVGLTGAKGVDNGGKTQGGVVSVLVGRVDANKLFVKPIIDLQKSGQAVDPLLPIDSEDRIIGFNATDATMHTASAFKVRTMHTSTGKDYVIINGGVAADDTNLKTTVYALPVVRTDATDAKNIGFLAKEDATDKTKPFVIVSAAGDLLTNDKDLVKVGRGAGLPSVDTSLDVTEMRVVGDTIYISTAGDRTDNNKNAGIFASTALFDKNGVIRSWTPWQRVMGSTDVTKGFGLDKVTGNFWYLTTDDGKQQPDTENTVKVTQWGRSAAASSYLATKYPQSKAGVHHIFSYGEKTPGFKTDEFAMDTAVGLDTVSLFQTGNKANANVLGLVTDGLSDTTVFNFNDDVIKGLGPITSTEVSRNSTDTNKGWVFVGGYSGVGVLSKADGTGFDGSAGLDELSSTAGKFPADFAFRKLVTKDPVDFSHVRKLQSDGTNLYVMTRDKLYKFAMNADNFKAASPTAVTAATTLVVPDAKLSDFVITEGGKIMLATTKGLFLSTDGTSASKVKDTPDSPIVQLQYFSEDRTKVSNKGNLYLLAADMSKSSATLHRFDVDASTKVPTIIPILNPDVDTTTGQIINFNEFKGNAVTDGSFVFSQLSKHFDQTDFVNLNPVEDLATTYQITPQLDLDDKKFNVGMMIRDEASGAWIVPVDAGIRVNQ